MAVRVFAAGPFCTRTLVSEVVLRRELTVDADINQLCVTLWARMHNGKGVFLAETRLLVPAH